MPKMVIEVPDQFVEVGKAMAEHLSMLQRTVDRLGGGKAVDYAAVEEANRKWGGQDRISSPRRNPEESGHRCSSSGDWWGAVHASGTV